MRVDKILLEGLCSCGHELEIDDAPDPKKVLPMISELRKKCKNESCRRTFHVHVQEILPII